MGLNLPASVTVDYQPYGVETLVDLVEGDYNGFPTITGRVSKGSQTSRLFQYASTRDTTGQRRTIYGVKQEELDRGHIVRVAM